MNMVTVGGYTADSMKIIDDVVEVVAFENRDVKDLDSMLKQFIYTGLILHHNNHLYVLEAVHTAILISNLDKVNISLKYKLVQ